MRAHTVRDREQVERAATSTCLGLAARWRKRTDHRATGGHDQKCTIFRTTLYQQLFAILQILGILLTISFVSALIDFMRQGLFAVTVNRNRGHWFELVWDKAMKRIERGEHKRSNAKA